MRQQRIWNGIIIICLMVKILEGKSLNGDTKQDKLSARVKRGYSKYGENEYGPSIQISSGVLQYGNHEDSGHTDISSHFETSSVNEDPWKSSGLSPGYDVWLEPSSSYHPSSSFDIHTSSIPSSSSSSSSHPGSDFIANTIFSDNSHHTTQPESIPTSQLHTQIISSAVGDSSVSIGDHSISTISDNIDFSNVADLKSKHYAKSYGK